MKKETKNNVSYIEAPAEAHKFQFRIKSDINSVVTKQVTSVTIDYVAKEITVILEQPMRNGTLHEYIAREAELEQIVVINTMSGQDAVPVNIMEFHTEIKAHTFRLDYAANDIAKHVLIFGILQ